MTKEPFLADAKEFDDLVRAAAGFHRLLPVFVVKDYWLTSVLRAVALAPSLKGHILFKGGTSLSKGWRLIERFSEDVDLLLTGPGFGDPPATKGGREKLMKAVRGAVEARTPLRIPDRKAVGEETWRFYYSRDDWHCNLRFALPERPVRVGAPGDDWILLESGFRGGANPHETRPIRSFIAEFLDTLPQAREALRQYDADLAPFDLALVKPERTLAEKLLLLHMALGKGLDAVRSIPPRHYYDVSQLLAKSPDVERAISDRSLLDLVRDAARVSNTYFGARIDVAALDISRSEALNPSPVATRILRARYDAERDLYARAPVAFDEILRATRTLATRLA
jgi:hypothetical protein